MEFYAPRFKTIYDFKKIQVLINVNKNLFFHFSVDDVIKSLIEITDQKIKIKDHWFFSILYKIHKKYNLKISLYLFYAEKINSC